MQSVAQLLRVLPVEQSVRLQLGDEYTVDVGTCLQVADSATVLTSPFLTRVRPYVAGPGPVIRVVGTGQKRFDVRSIGSNTRTQLL